MAVKTEIEVERDFYSFIKNGSLGNAIRGEVYRPDMRPSNAKTEDLIVKFLAGLDEQIQTGVVILNIYIPDTKNSDGRMVRDAASESLKGLSDPSLMRMTRPSIGWNRMELPPPSKMRKSGNGA